MEVKKCKVYGSKERARSGEHDDKDTDYGDDEDDDGDDDDDDEDEDDDDDEEKKLSSQAWTLSTLYHR